MAKCGLRLESSYGRCDVNNWRVMMIRRTISMSFVLLFVFAGSVVAADVDQLKRDSWSWLDSQGQMLESVNMKIWSYADRSIVTNCFY